MGDFNLSNEALERIRNSPKSKVLLDEMKRKGLSQMNPPAVPAKKQAASK